LLRVDRDDTGLFDERLHPLHEDGPIVGLRQSKRAARIRHGVKLGELVEALPVDGSDRGGVAFGPPSREGGGRAGLTDDVRKRSGDRLGQQVAHARGHRCEHRAHAGRCFQREADDVGTVDDEPEGAAEGVLDALLEDGEQQVVLHRARTEKRARALARRRRVEQFDDFYQRGSINEVPSAKPHQ
jgi:hypothetical protein